MSVKLSTTWTTYFAGICHTLLCTTILIQTIASRYRLRSSSAMLNAPATVGQVKQVRTSLFRCPWVELSPSKAPVWPCISNNSVLVWEAWKLEFEGCGFMISWTGLWQSKQSGNLLPRCVSSGTDLRAPSFLKLRVIRDIIATLWRKMTEDKMWQEVHDPRKSDWPLICKTYPLMFRNQLLDPPIDHTHISSSLFRFQRMWVNQATWCTENVLSSNVLQALWSPHNHDSKDKVYGTHYTI